jgi:hypothetical protein
MKKTGEGPSMLYFSTSVSEADGILGARLQALAAVYGLKLRIADHSGHPEPPMSGNATNPIDFADLVIGLVTRDSKRPDDVMKDIRYALAHDRPAMLLLEKDAPAQGLDGIHVISFDRSAPRAHEKELVEALKPIRAECRPAAFWLAIFAMGFMNLGWLVA